MNAKIKKTLTLCVLMAISPRMYSDTSGTELLAEAALKAATELALALPPTTAKPSDVEANVSRNCVGWSRTELESWLNQVRQRAENSLWLSITFNAKANILKIGVSTPKASLWYDFSFNFVDEHVASVRTSVNFVDGSLRDASRP